MDLRVRVFSRVNPLVSYQTQFLFQSFPAELAEELRPRVDGFVSLQLGVRSKLLGTLLAVESGVTGMFSRDVPPHLKLPLENQITERTLHIVPVLLVDIFDVLGESGGAVKSLPALVAVVV